MVSAAWGLPHGEHLTSRSITTMEVVWKNLEESRREKDWLNKPIEAISVDRQVERRVGLGE